MATDHEMHSKEGNRISPCGPTLPPAGKIHFPNPSHSERLDSPVDYSPESFVQPAPEMPKAHTSRIQETGRTTFELGDIGAIAVRCTACQTVVHFPRIHWVSAPECCPNCDTRWTRQPASQDVWPQDPSTYVFETILAFREALQALAAVGPSAVFTLVLEIEESRYHGKTNSTTPRRKGNAHA